MEREPRRAPWSVRLVEAVPLPPLWVGVGFASALIATYFGIEYATGQIDRVLAGQARPHIAGHFRSAVINALLLAFFPTAQVYLDRWTREHIAELEPQLRPAKGAARTRRPEPLAAPQSRVAGAVVAAVLVAIFVLPAGASQMTTRDYWIFEHAWTHAITIPLGWLMGRFLYAMVVDSLYVSRLASRLAAVDLLDPAPLYPFVRQGTRSALLTIAVVFIASGHVGNVVIPGRALAFTLMGALILAGAALVVPLLGVRQRIREEKRARLATLRDAIRAGEQAALGKGARAQRAAADLPGLLALEARIEAVREWPIDSTSLLRVALYVALGLGSWLGAAGVERLLDRALA